MRNFLKIFTILILTQLSTWPGETNTSFDKYYQNYCGDSTKQFSSKKAILVCNSAEDPQPVLEGEKSIASILKNLENQNLKKLCDNPDNFKNYDQILVGKDDQNLFTLPANPCSCSLKSNLMRKNFCSISKEDIKNIPEHELYVDLLQKLDAFENYQDSFGKCASSIFGIENLKKHKSLIKKLKNNYDLSMPSMKKLSDLVSALEDAPEDKVDSNCQENYKAEISSFNEGVKNEILDLKSSLGDKIDIIVNNIDIYNCFSVLKQHTPLSLLKTTSFKSIQNTILTNQGLLSDQKHDKENIIEEELEVRRKNYSKVLEESKELTAELDTLTTQLENVKNEKQLNDIYSRIDQIKNKLLSFGKYGYSFKDHSSSIKEAKTKIAGIARSKGYKIANYNNNDDYYSYPKNHSNDFNHSKNNEKISHSKNTTVKDLSSAITASNSQNNKAYTPFYLPKAKVNKTNIVPETQKKINEKREQEKQARAQSVTNNIKKTFSGANSNTKATSSRSPASTGGAPSYKISALESYKIPNEKKEPEVLNDKSFPNIKVVFIDDIKIMKLFKLENSTYKLKEEISKEEFIENFDQFPAMVKEQGRDFFRVFDAKNLSN